MSRVWLRMAGTSDATKYSFSPRPTTTGGPERAATILLGSWREIKTSAKTPVSCFTACADGVFEVTGVVFLDEMGDNFGVGFGDEIVALRAELVLQREIVLDDAIVDHDDVAGAIAVRVRVLFGGTAVRGPAGVADAVGAIHGIGTDGFFEIAQFAGGAANGELIVAVEDRDAGRIVAAIFQSPQAIEDDGDRFTRSEITDYSAHTL